MTAVAPPRVEPPGRWALLTAMSIAVLLVLGTWFSGSAVAPALVAEWRIDAIGVATLTVAVQVGFAVSALVLAALGAPDVVPARWLMAAGALVATLANAGFALAADDLAGALPFRFLTGAGIAAVYPVGMKVLAGWFDRERGLAVGTLIAAVTLGSALPHLLRAAGVLVAADWRSVILAASVGSGIGALICAVAVRDGPYSVPAARFSPAVAMAALRVASVRLANLGYLGHMWELFAMWSWVPLFLAASLAASGVHDDGLASLAAFVVVGSGAIGCIIAGALADRLGRTTVTIAAMAVSGSCALVTGLLFGAWPIAVLALSVAWGITVVADSAQFSTAVSELSPPGTAGSALTVQTAAGFLLTSITIWGVSLLGPDNPGGWRIAFGLLALGPLVGIWAMWRLRRQPDATLMASGRR
ncbi:MAG TPA: MFS transporter [Candidatus Limnocylindria bacterium]|nr:MFS transporter [Candidatus Limnocylindria bacterium]